MSSSEERGRDAAALPTSAFDYELPPGLIAQHPAARRDESRLLVLDRASGRIEHRVFRDIVELVPAGDALVLNETRVFPARLLGRRAGGGPAEVLLLHPAGTADPAGVTTRDAESAKVDGDVALPPAGASEGEHSSAASAVDVDPEGRLDVWTALVRPGSKLRPGKVVEVGPDLEVEVLDVLEDGTRVVRLRSPLPAREAIARYGRVPLPPYIEREAGREDEERYQTVYARREGSVAAPTAGLHLTPALLGALEERGVRIVRLVLHVGVGTFRPVEVEDPAEHAMHAEWYEVGAEAAAALNEARAAGGAVWAVGTTVTRTLETVADEAGAIQPGSGWTRLFIRPPYRFRGVDRLVTNFHLPRSTLLMLVAAFGGYEPVMRAYAEAVRRGYRFYSYGDAMVVV